MSGSVQSASVYSAPALGVAHRGERRSQHDAPRAGVSGGAQDAERALPGGDDEFIRIARLGDRDRRGNVMDLLTTRHRERPAIIGRQLGDDDLQSGVVRVTTTDGFS